MRDILLVSTRSPMNSLAFGGMVLLVHLMLAWPSAAAQVTYDNAAIHISERDGYLHLTVPVSRLEMRLQKLGFVRASPRGSGATVSRRHFVFWDSSRQIGLSGWFESDSRFKGARPLWEEELASRPGALARPQNVAFAELAGWQTIAFDLDAPQRAIAHLKAHWVQSGTWIELHLSAQDDRTLAERRAILLEVLRSVRVSEKASVSGTTSVVLEVSGKTWQVRLDLPATQKVYLYDLKDPKSPGHAIEGGLLVASVGAGSVTLLSYPLRPHQDCNAAIVGSIIGLATEKRVDPEMVKFFKHERYSVHLYTRKDVPSKSWDAVFAVDEWCLKLTISMPRLTKDDDAIVTAIIKSLNVMK